MGTDIHLHTEIKVDGVWHHYSHPRLHRDGDLFDFLRKLAPDRGLPDDASFTTRFDYKQQEDDYYNESYLVGAEIQKLDDWLAERDQKRPHLPGASFHPEIDYLFGNSWGGFTRWRTEFPEAIEEIRFVFWYDN